LDPEILLVDEVLAVGDAAFQKKCLGKMGEVAGEGRTVLFVSHNMGAIGGICERGLVFHNGVIVQDAPALSAIQMYLSSLANLACDRALHQRQDRKGNGQFRFTSVKTMTHRHGETNTIWSGDTLILEASYIAHTPLEQVSISIPFFTPQDQAIFACSTKFLGTDYPSLPHQGKIRLIVPKFPLREGMYYFNLWCEVKGKLADWVQRAGYLQVQNGDFFGTGRPTPQDIGICFVQHYFEVQAEPLPDPYQ